MNAVKSLNRKARITKVIVIILIVIFLLPVLNYFKSSLPGDSIYSFEENIGVTNSNYTFYNNKSTKFNLLSSKAILEPNDIIKFLDVKLFHEIEGRNISLLALDAFYNQSEERINFAKKVSFDAHIQRHQIIDLFLDTFPYNAHTSASDSLWAGCPIISVSGETFASRVAGSILTEIGCSELVVSSFEEYEKKAIELASQPDKIISLKQKILALNKTSNLFKPKKFTLDLEAKMTDLMN